MSRSLFARIVAAAALSLVAAATGVLIDSPAFAAVCASHSGVSVVVDPGALGGSIQTVCDSGSDEVASTRLDQSGFALTFAQRQPGFVCRVNGIPASDPCINTSPDDAYWGVFWSDGISGTWNYATLGATSLSVPDGGAVALAWQGGGGRRTPGIAAPVQVIPTPNATTKPTPKQPVKPSPTIKPTPTRTPTETAPPPESPATTVSPTSTPTPSATESSMTTKPKPKPKPTPTKSPIESPSETTTTAEPTEPVATATPSEPAAEPGSHVEEDSTRIPTWLTLTVLGLLLVSIGATAVAARRRTRN